MPAKTAAVVAAMIMGLFVWGILVVFFGGVLLDSVVLVLFPMIRIIFLGGFWVCIRGNIKLTADERR